MMNGVFKVTVLAQAVDTNIQAALSKVLGLLMLIGFVYGVIKVIGGAANYNRDPDGAKQSIIAGVLIAGAVAIMTVVFRAFGIDVTGLNIDVTGF
ncbi:MAG: hypothetical protein EOP86_27095 [Verrucomicrobiaceae bacterium]|nr:MAG: hypothetical protein EOP86_27095 [Verrucomicrobiaceae bacterium]